MAPSFRRIGMNLLFAAALVVMTVTRAWASTIYWADEWTTSVPDSQAGCSYGANGGCMAVCGSNCHFSVGTYNSSTDVCYVRIFCAS